MRRARQLPSWMSGALLLGAALALGGCQQGDSEALSGNPIAILTVDVRLDAADSRTGATVTVDIAPPGAPQSGVTPLSITETVNTPGGAAIIPVDAADDATPPNRYTAGRIEIQ